MFWQICQIAQLSGSMSSSVGWRPVAIETRKIARETAGPNTAVNVSSVPGRFHGSSTSSTSWPSERSRSAASSTAAAHSGCTSASIGGVFVVAIRSLPGVRPAVVAKGSLGSGAHDASPIS